MHGQPPSPASPLINQLPLLPTDVLEYISLVRHGTVMQSVVPVYILGSGIRGVVFASGLVVVAWISHFKDSRIIFESQRILSKRKELQR